MHLIPKEQFIDLRDLRFEILTSAFELANVDVLSKAKNNLQTSIGSFFFSFLRMRLNFKETREPVK